MARVHLPTELRRLVIARARACCEYCLLHRDDTEFSHQVDHLVAVKHNGLTIPENLSYACQLCNRYKGSDVATYDSLTNELTPLFNPRAQSWGNHFRLSGVRIEGLTAIGRATAQLLRLNDEARLLDRQALSLVGRYPPRP